jgi:hypothetical protein
MRCQVSTEIRRPCHLSPIVDGNGSAERAAQRSQVAYAALLPKKGTCRTDTELCSNVRSQRNAHDLPTVVDIEWECARSTKVAKVEDLPTIPSESPNLRYRIKKTWKYECIGYPIFSGADDEVLIVDP